MKLDADGGTVKVGKLPEIGSLYKVDHWSNAPVVIPPDAGTFKIPVPRPLTSDPTPKFLTLPTDSEVRKGYPLMRGCLAYFPAALAGVARHSEKGNQKHNPGQPLHHARGKSMDHSDCIIRHLIDLEDLQACLNEGRPVVPGLRARILDEANALAWRALALAQELHEKFDNAPLAPAAKV